MIMVSNPPRRFAIATHPSQPQVADGARDLVERLKVLGAEQVAAYSIYEPELKQMVQQKEIDVLIALGGDGTMLRAGHLVAPMGIAVLGINRGRFGFLMEIDELECEDRLNQLLRGEYRLEKRMMLHSVHRREDQKLGEWHVLNEVVVCRGQYVRPIQVKARLDGYLLASYVADGVIAATATGSTAYALAVGGPIMPPELRNILIVAVAPHLSVDRSIILSEGSHVTLAINTNHEAVLSADGQPPVILKDGDEVDVCASEHTINFVRFQDQGYFYRNLHKYMEQNPIAGTL
ncbi:MAG TPA: NAD(+)/NADH kinase [Gammaproteobacteria bacterium]|nr:NAD(+)/NADH kinase [Gammaproteobacteria bacterium]